MKVLEVPFCFAVLHFRKIFWKLVENFLEIGGKFFLE